MKRWLAVAGVVLVGLILAGRAVYSIDGIPEIYRVYMTGNDYKSALGTGLPGSTVQLWYTQRPFKQGIQGSTTDPFRLCEPFNGGEKTLIGSVVVGNDAKWKIENPGWLQLTPANDNRDACGGGLLTIFYLEEYQGGIEVRGGSPPVLSWIRIRRPDANLANVEGKVSLGNFVAASIADGPNDGDDGLPLDADEDGLNTCRQPGFTCQQTISWQCGGGATFTCPTATVLDSTAGVFPPPAGEAEFPYVLGTIIAHRGWGSLIATAAAPRPPLAKIGINVNVRVRGIPDIPGCDQNLNLFNFSLL
jgi:hypothetical protein